MATIQHKRSTTTGSVPATLAAGELALNSADVIVYGADSTGAVRKLAADWTTNPLAVGSASAAGSATISPLAVHGGNANQGMNTIAVPPTLAIDTTFNGVNASYAVVSIAVTDTASSGANWLINARVGSSPVFQVDQTGCGLFASGLWVGGATPSPNMSPLIGGADPVLTVRAAPAPSTIDILQIRDNNSNVLSGISSYGTTYGGWSPDLCGGRLTLSSTDTYPIADQTSQTTLYYLPHSGRTITLYTTAGAGGYENVSIPDAGWSISLAGLTANTNYDIYAKNNMNGTGGLEIGTAWASDTGRATNCTPVKIGGMYWKNNSGTTDQTRRFVGTIRITATAGQCEDSVLRRYCWNAYNQLQRQMQCAYNPASFPWTLSNGSSTNAYVIRPTNGNASALRVEWVCGLPGACGVTMNALGCLVPGNSGTMGFGVSLDLTANWTAPGFVQSTFNGGPLPMFWAYQFGVESGHHWLVGVEGIYASLANQSMEMFPVQSISASIQC